MRRQVMLPRLQQCPYFIFPESVGWYQDFPDHSIYRQEGYYDSYSIHFILSGKGYVEIEGEQHVLQKAMLFCIFRFKSSVIIPPRKIPGMFVGFILRESSEGIYVGKRFLAYVMDAQKME